MSELWIYVITGIIAAASVRFLMLRNTKGNEFQLYRIHYTFTGSERTITVGMFSGKAKAEEALDSLRKRAVEGISFGIEKVKINCYVGREGNLVYEWKANTGETSSYFFFTKEELIEELKAKLKAANNGNDGELNSYEINKLYFDENGSPEAAV